MAGKNIVFSRRGWHFSHMPSKHFKDQTGIQPHSVILPWIMRLRWGSVATQALMVLIIRFTVNFNLPLLPLILLLVFQGAGNFILIALSRNEKAAGVVFTAAMFIDVILFTLVLAYTGGPMNPFTFFYLVHLTIGAMLMPPVTAGFLSLCAIGGYALLFLVPDLNTVTFQPSCHIPAATPAMILHLKGMWLAFAVTAMAVIFLASRIRERLNEHRRTIEILREEQGRSEKLASLATLAAGCAHELSTPLATIAVAAAELEEELAELNGGDELRDDAGLIRTEVKKCKEILAQMSHDAGETPGEALRSIKAGLLFETVIKKSAIPAPTKVTVDIPEAEMVLLIPEGAIGRTLRALIKNCVDADATEIDLGLRQQDEMLIFSVSDNGRGMTPATLDRAMEPFFTTKEAGMGMGLGLYLARTLSEHLAGRLEISSGKDRGTTVRIIIPEKRDA